MKSLNEFKIIEIEKIVLDDEILLKKIKTDKRTIYINNARIISDDAERLIKRLKRDSEKYDIKIIDSWDEIAEKGYLKIAYIISSCMLILSILSVIIVTIFRGFHPFSLSVLLLFIPQIILYRKQMKDKIN